MMYDHEKSDPAIVAVKPTNKVGQPAAELVEPRAGAEGNVRQQSTGRAQYRGTVSQALERIRQAARQRKKEKFTALFHHVSIDHLAEAFSELKENAAAGVDGLTCRDYEQHLERNLEDLHARVHRGAYRALPSRRVYIPKADGRQRPIAVAALEDKIVQRATAAGLSAIYEEDFLGFAAENRKRRGLGKPETFTFLGFTFICSKTRRGKFQIKRKSRRDRMQAKLQAIKQELRRSMHQPIPQQGRWLQQVVTGYFNYHAVPTNNSPINAFLFHVTNLWRRTLQWRSQKDGMTWERIKRLADHWLPKPRILHPWPESRFAVRHPRWEPYARIGPVRICAGGAR